MRSIFDIKTGDNIDHETFSVPPSTWVVTISSRNSEYDRKFTVRAGSQAESREVMSGYCSYNPEFGGEHLAGLRRIGEVIVLRWEVETGDLLKAVEAYRAMVASTPSSWRT